MAVDMEAETPVTAVNNDSKDPSIQTNGKPENGAPSHCH
jgi:hypothetical protein